MTCGDRPNLVNRVELSMAMDKMAILYVLVLVDARMGEVKSGCLEVAGSLLGVD
jgi:hypothetical protein